MGIEFIIHGDYRHGTTIMWWLYKLEYPEAIHLYEPLHPDLFNILSKWTRGKEYPLHKLPVLDDYFDLPKQILDEMKKYHKDFTNVFDPNEVFPYLDVINRWSNMVNRKIFLQPNRMHFILTDVAKKYNCPCIHIVRNPCDVFLSYFPKSLTENEQLIRAIIEGRVHESVYAGAFYLPVRYKAISERYGFKVPENDWLAKFAVVWSIGNGEAVKAVWKYEKGTVVYYEDVCMIPLMEFKRIAEITGIRPPLRFINLLRRDRIGKYPKWLMNEFLKRIEEYSLEQFLKGWFIYS